MSEIDSRVYLDYNATTPLAEEVLESITDALKNAWGNPSSSHYAGVKAKRIIDKSRENVARMLGSKSSDIIFTSGGTEANNWILQSVVKNYNNCVSRRSKLPHIVTSNIEHDSIKCVLENFEQAGIAEVSYVAVSKTSGCVEIDDIVSVIKPTTCLITIMLANNETGIIQPIGDISRKVKSLRRIDNESQILVHTDAAQAIGKIPVDVFDLEVDYLTIVGHKFYGPRIGAIYVKEPVAQTPLIPLMFGGGQERNLRPGTENTGMIAGLGKAAELVANYLQTYQIHMLTVRDHLEEKLRVAFGDNICINGKFTSSERLPNTCNVSFLNTKLKGYEILKRTKHILASVGAACHSKIRPSHILLAVGVPEKTAWCALRLSVGRETLLEEIDSVVEDLKQAVGIS